MEVENAAGNPAGSAIKDMGLPWVEKYRPSSLDDVVSQDNIVQTRAWLVASTIQLHPNVCPLTTPLSCPAVEKLVASQKMPHLLFYGPPGTGKTSTVLAIAKQMYGQNLSQMVLQALCSRQTWAGKR